MGVEIKKVKINERKDKYYFITVPKAFIDNELLSTSKKYDLVLEEAASREGTLDANKKGEDHLK